MKSVKISFFFIFFIASLLVISSTITNASATNGWAKSENPPQIRHTATNPGSTKICGDHICGPFENMKKPLQNITKQSQSIHLINHTKIEKIHNSTIAQESKVNPVTKNIQKL
ncbi:MAG: hypothetical protein KGI28_06870 [Thaumarchaeota archaeon]|nr:hypothetical protein [Nitrososphaerota archaeon]